MSDAVQTIKSEISTVRGKFNEAKSRMRAAREEARKVAQEAFREGIESVFTGNRVLTAIKWRQYTPYFNDGEECVFGVNEPEIFVGDMAEELIEEDEGISEYDARVRPTSWQPTGNKKQIPLRDGTFREEDEYAQLPNPQYDPHLGAVYGAVKAFLKEFDDDDFKDLFGDHRQITVKRKDGTIVIDVDEYQHD